MGLLLGCKTCAILAAHHIHALMQFESIANFGAVIDRLGEFQEVLESSAMSRSTSTDTDEGDSVPAGQQSLIQLVDQPGAFPVLCKNTSSLSMVNTVSGALKTDRHTDHGGCVYLDLHKTQSLGAAEGSKTSMPDSSCVVCDSVQFTQVENLTAGRIKNDMAWLATQTLTLA